MDISTLNREQLKDIIRANDWDDKPALTVSEEEMERYLQGKLDSGELTFGSINDGDKPDNADDAVAAAADEAKAEGAGDTEETDDGPACVDGDERVVEVALLRPLFLTEGVETKPEFDEDGVPTVKAKMGIKQAKILSQAGVVQLHG